MTKPSGQHDPIKLIMWRCKRCQKRVNIRFFLLRMEKRSFFLWSWISKKSKLKSRLFGSPTKNAEKTATNQPHFGLENRVAFALTSCRINSEFAQTKKHNKIFCLIPQIYTKMKFSLVAIAAVLASAEAISKPSLSVSPIFSSSGFDVC